MEQEPTNYLTEETSPPNEALPGPLDVIRIDIDEESAFDDDDDTLVATTDFANDDETRAAPIDPLAALEGAAFLATGLWPIVHRASFERVAGRQRDPWLLDALGLLSAAVGISLIGASRRRSGALLGGTTALAMAAADLLRLRMRRFGARPMPYLMDAACNLAIAATWGLRAAREARALQREEASR